MEYLKQLLEKKHISYTEEEPLRQWCTFHIGGPAKIFISPKNTEEISIVVKAVQETQVPLFILGKGSNILFADSGYNGVVLHLGDAFSNMEKQSETVLYAESGVSLMKFCMFALEHGLSGMEQLYGIPGTVGGALYMNAGAYGGETKDVAISSSHIDLSGELGVFYGKEMELSYRHSAYTENQFVITGMAVELTPDDPKLIRERMDDYMNRRKTKQPLEFPSGGSTFKRPPNHYASALIDECGLKGLQVGDAQISEKHAGFVINRGNATCKDVMELIDQVKKTVLDQKAVALECEIKIIG